MNSNNNNTMSMDIVEENPWEQIEPMYSIQSRSLAEYPPNTVQYGYKFKEFPVSTKLSTGITIRMAFGDVFDSNNFWFRTNAMANSFYEMNKKINTAYNMIHSSELSLASSHICPGQICIVPKGEGWARGVICGLLMGTTINVFLVDLGITFSVEANLIKYMLEQFMTLPIQAIRGSTTEKLLKEISDKREFKADVVNTLEWNDNKTIAYLDIKNLKELFVEEKHTTSEELSLENQTGQNNVCLFDYFKSLKYKNEDQNVSR